MSQQALISIIDDDEPVREAIKNLMRSVGFAVEGFASALDFLASPHLHGTACVIADVHMARMTGFELHNRLRELGYAIPTILITAYHDDTGRARALRAGVISYLSKPVSEEALLGGVRSALAARRS